MGQDGVIVLSRLIGFFSGQDLVPSRPLLAAYFIGGRNQLPSRPVPFRPVPFRKIYIFLALSCLAVP